MCLQRSELKKASIDPSKSFSEGVSKSVKLLPLSISLATVSLVHFYITLLYMYSQKAFKSLFFFFSPHLVGDSSVSLKHESAFNVGECFGLFLANIGPYSSSKVLLIDCKSRDVFAFYFCFQNGMNLN